MHIAMASLNFLPQPPTSASHSIPSRSSSFVPKKPLWFSTNCNLQATQRRPFLSQRKQSLVLKSAVGDVSVVEPPPPPPPPFLGNGGSPYFDLFASLKFNLLVCKITATSFGLEWIRERMN